MSIATTTLARVDDARFQKAAAALRKGEYVINLAHVDSAVVTAHVRNGRGSSYTVSLTENGGFCSCPDFAFRTITGKHQTALAVRLVQDGTVIPEAPAPDLSLKRARRDFGFPP